MAAGQELNRVTGAMMLAKEEGEGRSAVITQKAVKDPNQSDKTLARPLSPGSQRFRFFLFPCPKPGSSARRTHSRWLLCSWLGAVRRRITACRRLAGCRRGKPTSMTTFSAKLKATTSPPPQSSAKTAVFGLRALISLSSSLRKLLLS
ncbi:uncharacterized protein LOC130933644 [Arachis stenosperma]|uniref:uncharacterized protein LOC130933644 n=1 Tax=Arachis stenosperma TaxID=217475 RepID=UPI0025AD4958|nr:uncharacterized protein LOC130933644 [Arachis stenosperma]